MRAILRTLVCAVTVRNEAAPVPSPPKPVVLPPEDEAEPERGDDLGHAEGQSFMIEYRDAGGRLSTRRITVWSLGQGAGGVPVLKAFCHERKAQRTFRVDRIACCIDYGGEIHDDVASFMAENFGMAQELARQAAAPADPWAHARPIVHHDAAILSALSLCDGLMRDGEVRIAAEHCAALAAARGVTLDEAGYRALIAFIRRQRPTERSLLDACDALYDRPAQEVTDFMVAAVAVMDADGVRAPEEEALVNRLALDLTGMEVC